jgi:hypothetical protein
MTKSKMKIPRTIRIGAYTYRVKMEKPNEDNAAAVIRYDEGVIVITPETTETRIQELLLHEILHGCTRTATGRPQGTKEETLISLLAPALLATMQDNPDAIKFLMERH